MLVPLELAQLSSTLTQLSSHELEVAETLIGVIRFLLIFVAARTLAEVLVRLQLPTILGELLAGVIIGASGLHLLVPPETQAHLSDGFSNLIAGLAAIPPETIPDIYNETFPSLQSVATLGLYALLFLTGLESELDELVAVGGQAFTVAVAGVVLPFALGTAGLMAIFHVDLIPAVFAGIRSTWKTAIRPAVPRAKGSTTPATATVNACPPTATSSSSSLSRPMRNSRA